MANVKFNILNNDVSKQSKQNPETLAILSKLRLGRNIQSNQTSNFDLSQSLLYSTKISKEKITHNDDILVLFPDTLLAIEMIIGSMLSPNDLSTRNLLYHAPDDLDIAPTIKQEVMRIIKDHLNKEYEFESKFQDIIKESLFTKGAYVELVIPEASLDDLINKPTQHTTTFESYHSYKDNYGLSYLGELKPKDTNEIKEKLSKSKYSSEANKKLSTHYKTESRINFKVSFESYANHVQISNNREYNKTIKLPIITDNEKLIKDRKTNLKNISNAVFNSKYKTESLFNTGKEEKLNLDSIFKPSYKHLNRNNDIVIINPVSDASRKSIGKPLIFKVSPESVIPVHAKDDPKSHIGYFVAIDDQGNPLSANEELYNMMNNEGSLSGSNGPFGNGLDQVSRIKNNIYGNEERDVLYEENERLYIKLVEEMITRKIKNGSFGETAEVQGNVDIYRMMFYRSLKDQGTKLIYLPNELVCYWAFNYRSNGTGESLLEKVAPLFSIRGILLMVTILSYIKNAITTTNVDITLDEKESMPEIRVEEIISQIMQTNDRAFPLGMMRIHELQDWAIRSGYKFNIDSPTLPDIKVTSEQSNPDFKLPEEDFDALFYEKILNTFGIAPEMVKQGLDPEFATTVVYRNVINNQRIKEKQKVFNTLATEAIIKILKSDQLLKEKIFNYLTKNHKSIIEQYVVGYNSSHKEKIEIKNITNEDKKKIIAYIYLQIQEHLYVTLPEPRSTEAPLLYNTITTEFQQIDELINGIYDGSAFEAEDSGDMGSKMELLRGMLKVQTKLKVLQEYNLSPELIDIFTLNNENNNLVGSDVLRDFLNGREALVSNFLKALAIYRGQTNVSNLAIEKIASTSNNDDSMTGDGGGGSSFGGSDDNEGGDEDEGGDDDGDEFGMGDGIEDDEGGSDINDDDGESTKIDDDE